MKQNKKLLIFFGTVMFFNMAASFAHPVTPTLIVERGLDSSMFGVALAAMMLVNFLLSPFWGKLCGYIPTKRIMLICGIGYSIGQAIFGMAQSEIMVVGGRMFAGIFTGGAFTSFSNYVLNITTDPKESGKNLTTLVTIQNVCGAVGYFIGGMLGLMSVEAAFIAQVAVLALTGTALFFICEDDTPFKPVPTKPLTIKEANPFSAFISAKNFMTPMLFMIFAIVAISAIGQNSYEQCFNYFIKDQFGMGSEYNGTIKAVIAVLTLGLNATVGMYLQKKTDINKTFIWAVIANTAITGLILVFTQQLVFVVAYIVWSGVNTIRMSLLQTMVANRASEEHRNSMMGFYQSMNSLGGIFGALFAGLIYESGPMRPFMLAFAAFAISLAIGMVYITKYKGEAKVK
ncbi:MAG: MFS transporter [Clostridia bacterium]|nr:MFS transporter [Clostridia bacterium]